MPLIAFLTDFGLDDEYVGVMKGIILRINPRANILDICHYIPAQDVVKAACLLKAAYKFFPKGTIFVAIVDPGVGSGRRIVCVGARGYYFLAPDNGILSYVLEGQRARFAYEVTNKRYWLDEISDTFHGRDIFAPVAAHLSKGISPNKLGNKITSLKTIPLLRPRISKRGIEGRILFTDRFGNCITNIDGEILKEARLKNLQINIGGYRIDAIFRSYSDVGPRLPLAIWGSKGLLEISVNGGNAEQILKLKKGMKILIRPRD